MSNLGGYYYITKQGDMWDYIAYQVYGDEFKVPVLWESNPEHLETYIFDAGCRIWCPEIDNENEEDEGIPDWRDDEDPDDLDIESDDEEEDEDDEYTY